MAAFLKEGQMKVSLPKGGERILKPGDDLTGIIPDERIASLKKHGLVVDKNPLDTDQIVEKAVREDRNK